MSYVILCYPKCSTCAKACTWLDTHNIAYTVRDIKTENPTAEELRVWHQKSGYSLKRFFNTSGLVYRGLALADKLPHLSDDEQYSLLATDGMLVRRPMLVGDSLVLVGFREKDWESALAQSIK